MRKKVKIVVLTLFFVAIAASSFYTGWKITKTANDKLLTALSAAAMTQGDISKMRAEREAWENREVNCENFTGCDSEKPLWREASTSQELPDGVICLDNCPPIDPNNAPWKKIQGKRQYREPHISTPKCRVRNKRKLCLRLLDMPMRSKENYSISSQSRGNCSLLQAPVVGSINALYRVRSPHSIVRGFCTE